MSRVFPQSASYILRVDTGSGYYSCSQVGWRWLKCCEPSHAGKPHEPIQPEPVFLATATTCQPKGEFIRLNRKSPRKIAIITPAAHADRPLRPASASAARPRPRAMTTPRYKLKNGKPAK